VRGEACILRVNRRRRGVSATAARRGEPAIICADPRMKPDVVIEQGSGPADP
jgi:hypothetical protein